MTTKPIADSADQLQSEQPASFCGQVFAPDLLSGVASESLQVNILLAMTDDELIRRLWQIGDSLRPSFRYDESISKEVILGYLSELEVIADRIGDQTRPDNGFYYNNSIAITRDILNYMMESLK